MKLMVNSFLVLMFFLLSVVPGLAEGTATPYKPPSAQEEDLFAAKLARLNSHAPLIPAGHEVTDVTKSLNSPQTYTIKCPATDKTPARTVNVNVRTHHVAWDANKASALGAGVGGACFVEAQATGFDANNVKTVNIDFYIMLEPTAAAQDEADQALGQLCDEALLYHEYLHAQLLINAIKNSDDWKNKVCSCTVDLSPMDGAHQTIDSWVKGFLAAIAGANKSIYVVQPPRQSAKDDGTFEIDLVDAAELGKENWSYTCTSPGGGNVTDVTVVEENGKIKVKGKLIDKSKPGVVLVRIDPPSVYMVFGIEEGIVIDPYGTAATTTIPGGCAASPASPSHLQASIGDANTVNLSWRDNSSDEVGFKILRRCDDGTQLVITLGVANTTGYTDNLSIAGKNYFYSVSAYNDCGESSRTNEAQALPASSGGESSSDDGGLCFIASAAYGGCNTPAVKTLRQFRDDYLLTRSWGKKMVAFYYRYSPPLADVIAGSSYLRTLTRAMLTPLVAAAYALKHFYLLTIMLCIGGMVILVCLGLRITRLRQ